MDTYKALFHCDNCNSNPTVDIPKGTTKSGYRMKEKCPNCGCQNLIEHKTY